MDRRLIIWARRVKRKNPSAVPLWLFTDMTRLPDPLPAIARLPAGLCGVVFRHDSHPQRWVLARAVARLCRHRKLALLVAGDAKLAMCLRAGLHLRGGAGGRPYGWHGGMLSASVHDLNQLRQARLTGVRMIFISPVFATASHPGAPVLGRPGWHHLARQAGMMMPCALGGLNGLTAPYLGPLCAGVGAIEALL